MRVLCMCIAQKGVYSFIFELISLFVCPGNTLNLLRSILLYCNRFLSGIGPVKECGNTSRS